MNYFFTCLPGFNCLKSDKAPFFSSAHGSTGGGDFNVHHHPHRGELRLRPGPSFHTTTITRLNSSSLQFTANEKHVFPSVEPYVELS